jgi:hypothetical protein
MLVLEKLVKSSATHRKYGETKFGMERFVNGFGFNYHLVPFSFWKRPMHLLAPWDP